MINTLQLKGIRACVFDAYGTLFGVNAAAAEESESAILDTHRSSDLGVFTFFDQLSKRACGPYATICCLKLTKMQLSIVFPGYQI
jgi:hypothetical protein